MLSVLILAGVLGQVQPGTAPPRRWLPAIVEGKTVFLWGWRKPNGWVGYYPHEQPAAPARVMPRTPAEPLAPGQTIGPDGQVNNGLILKFQTTPKHQLDTNDPDVGRLLLQDGPHCAEHVDAPCPGPGPCPEPRPRPDPFPVPIRPEPKSDPWEAARPWLVPGAILIAAVLVVFARRP